MYVLFDNNSDQYVGFVSLAWRLVPTLELAHQFDFSSAAKTVAELWFSDPKYDVVVQDYIKPMPPEK